MAPTRGTLTDILERMRKYCAYQDRSHSEVRTKLLSLNVYGDDLENILAELVSEGFLNEERFARSFVRGKFTMNRWGRFKISLHLKQKGVSEYLIRKGMEEIDEDAYREALQKILERKLAGKTDFPSKRKALEFAMRRGFEPELIKSVLADLPDDQR